MNDKKPFKNQDENKLKSKKRFGDPMQQYFKKKEKSKIDEIKKK